MVAALPAAALARLLDPSITDAADRRRIAAAILALEPAGAPSATSSDR